MGSAMTSTEKVEEKSESPMKTVHIKGVVTENNETDFARLKTILKDLYSSVLNKDDLFHFFFEPELIIRVSLCNVSVVEMYLNKNGIKHIVYPYPIPDDVWSQFGEHNNAIVLDHLNLFLTVFHAHSVAAIIMNDKEHFDYLERMIHTAFNPRLISRQKEGLQLLKYSQFKLGNSELLKSVDEITNNTL
eukprot:129071_1